MNRHYSAADQALIFDLIASRRDVRGNKFLPKPVSDDTLDQILRAANLAPSVGLSQPWRIVVVDDAQIMSRIQANSLSEKERAEEGFSDEQKDQYRSMKLEGITEAPINLAVFYAPSNEKIIGNNSMPEVGRYSVVCAIQNMWLMARAYNVGLGWVSILDPKLVSSELNAPPTHELIAYLCLGYVSEFDDIPEFERLDWKHRKSIEHFVFKNRFSSKQSEGE